MFDNFRGVITFEAVAPQPETFINALKGSAVSASDISVRKGRVYGDIYRKDFEEVKRIAVSCGAQLCESSKRGGVFTVRKYRRRIGLVVGFVLAFAMVAYLSNVVMIVEIYGNETLTDDQIESMLKDQGISIGTFLPSVDLRDAEKRITSSSDMIAWIGIRSTGCRLQAEVREMTAPPEMVPTSVPCNVVSSRDAQIVEIRSVQMGMLVPMLYDGVKKGDLLISGTVEDGKGGVYYSHSMGEIIGRYTESVTFEQSLTDKIFDYGEKVQRNTFFFFGLKIPLYIGGNDFGSYEYDEETEYVKLWNICLPMGIIRSEYSPYETEQVVYSPEQARQILEEKIKLYEYNFFDEGDVTLVDREVIFSEDGEKASAEVKYTLESDIGVTREILVKR